MSTMKMTKDTKDIKQTLTKWLPVQARLITLAGALLLMGDGTAYGAADKAATAATTPTAKSTLTAAEATAASTSAAAGGESALVKYEFLTDIDKSKVAWSGTKIVGGGHEGDLKVKSGYITFAGGKPVAAEVVMDMNTINCTDLAAGSKSKQKLEAHLKNDDFFAVSEYPTATLKATSFKPYQGSIYAVEGELTIRGVTKPIGFTVDLVQAATTTKGSGSFEFDRVEFNVKYNSSQLFKTLGDKAINDIVRLSFNFEAGAS